MYNGGPLPHLLQPLNGPPGGNIFGILTEPRAYASLFYMLLSLATGTICFCRAITGLSLSISLLILIIGIPVLLLFPGTLHLARWIGRGHGLMAKSLLVGSL
jgi:hypothetical protein